MKCFHIYESSEEEHADNARFLTVRRLVFFGIRSILVICQDEGLHSFEFFFFFLNFIETDFQIYQKSYHISRIKN